MHILFSDIVLIIEPEHSTKWVPQYKLIEQIKKEEKKIREQAKKEAEEKKAFEIAKAMKKDNEPIDKIMRYTGLTKEEIEKIKKPTKPFSNRYLIPFSQFPGNKTLQTREF